MMPCYHYLTICKVYKIAYIVVLLLLLNISYASSSELPSHTACRLLHRAEVQLPYKSSSIRLTQTIYTKLLHSIRYFINKKDYKNKYKIDIKNQAKYIYTEYGEVKVYRPEIFSKIRKGVGISEEMYLNCLSIENLACLSSDSKSGQAFWVSNDGTIVLKTLKHYELSNLRDVLDSYYDHLVDSATCMASTLGIYRVITKSGIKKYFIVNRNVYPLLKSNILLKRYDIKGSTVGRKSSPTSMVYKDLDLIESGKSFTLGSAKELLLQVLERDVAFLSRHGFMDYSLLIAETSFLDQKLTNRILNMSKYGNSAKVIDHKGRLVVRGDNGKIYYFGIIDFLQKYTFRKVLETYIKRLMHDGGKISCVHPMLYARRLIAFINRFT